MHERDRVEHATIGATDILCAFVVADSAAREALVVEGRGGEDAHPGDIGG